MLSSSSSGNCSALIHGEGGTRAVTLIDAGLSPRRTRLMLAGLGLTIEQVHDIVLTHLDVDHCHPNWVRLLPRHVTLHVHRRHISRGMRSGLLHQRTEVFDEETRLRPGVRFSAVIASHDDLGTAAFRVSFDDAPEADDLGYATDIGRVTPELVEHLRSVAVLAIESNYCPDLQRASGRPRQLIRRIMDGTGHLSNQQSAKAVREIAPTRHLVLLHLSRQCNRPELAAAAHAGAPCPVTIAHWSEPSRPVRVV